MYFEAMPQTLYSLEDDRSNVKLVTNITTRIKINDEVKNLYGLYDEYDVKNGETPEFVAEKFYNNSKLHWIILHYNDIIDPRFDWVMDTNNLVKYVTDKYSNINGIHHYEDTNNAYTNGNVYLMSSAAFGNFSSGDVIINNTGSGTGFISTKVSSSNIIITVSTGGFNSGDQIKLNSNTQVNANITSTVTISGTPVTNYVYEDIVNEAKRKIKILKLVYVDPVVKDFKKNLEF